MGRATHRRTLKYGTNSRGGRGKTCGECESANGNDDLHGLAVRSEITLNISPLSTLFGKARDTKKSSNLSKCISGHRWCR